MNLKMRIDSEARMRKALFVVLIILIIAGISCGRQDKAPATPAAASSPAGAQSEPSLHDRAAVLDVLRNGDQADIQQLLGRLAQDRQGWTDGAYDDLYRPLWNFFVRINAPGTSAPNQELITALSNLFNFGDWYPLLVELLAVIKDPKAAFPVRQAAADHLWRFAGMAQSSGATFSIPPDDRTKIEAAVTDLLKDQDPGLLSTAAMTAARLNMTKAIPRLKEIAATRRGEGFDTRALRFTIGESLFNLGEKAAALAIMTAMAGSKGDFSEEAAEFIKKNGTK